MRKTNERFTGGVNVVNLHFIETTAVWRKDWRMQEAVGAGRSR